MLHRINDAEASRVAHVEDDLLIQERGVTDNPRGASQGNGRLQALRQLVDQGGLTIFGPRVIVPVISLPGMCSKVPS